MATTSDSDDPTIKIKTHAYGEKITTRTTKRYITSGIFVDNHELNGAIPGGTSWDDLKRQHMAPLYMQQIISLLVESVSGCSSPTNQNPDVSIYFIRATGVGFVILISVDTLQTTFSWSEAMAGLIDGSKPKKGKAMRDDPPPFTALTSPIDIVYGINSCIHPNAARSSPQPITLNPHLNYIFPHLSSFVDRELGSENRSVAQTDRRDAERAGRANEQEGAVVPHAPPRRQRRRMDAETINTIMRDEPCSALNILIALCVDRVFNSTTLANWDNIEWLCTDLPGRSIFRTDGSIDFTRLPPTAAAYKINIRCLLTNWFFPDHLPNTHLLKAALIRANRAFADVCGTMTEQHLRQCVLDECRFEDLQFFNPTRDNTYIEHVQVGTGGMPYFPIFADRIAQAASPASAMSPDQFDTFMAEQIQQILITMSEDHATTPVAPRGFAKTIRNSLTTDGLHFIRPDQRHTDSFSWLSFVLCEFHTMGVGTHITTIMLRFSIAALTGLVSRSGGVQIHLSGDASDGKSWLVGHKLRLLFPDMLLLQSVSPQAVYSLEAQRLVPWNVFCVDEVSDKTFGGANIPYSDAKNLFAASIPIKRFRDTSFAQPKGGKATIRTFNMPAPCTFLGVGNCDWKHVVHEHERGTVGPTSAGASRVASTSLPPLGESGRRHMTLRTVSGGSAPEIHRKSNTIRVFFAHCAFVSLCLSHHVFQYAYNPLHIYYAEQLAEAFARVCPSYPLNDNRLRSHLVSTPLVATVMNLVYEHIMCGGVHNKTPTLLEYSRILVEISKRLIPSVQHVVFGTTMLLEMYNGTSTDDVFATRLLQHIKSEHFNAAEKAFQLSPRVISSIALELGIPPKNFESQLKQLSFMKVDNPSNDVRTAYAARPDLRTPGGWLLNPAFVRRGIDARSPVDIVVHDHVTSLFVDGERPVSYDVPFLQLVRALMDAAEHDSTYIPKSEMFAIEVVRKRVFLGWFIPSDTADATCTWINLLCAATIPQFSNPIFRETWARRHISITREYIDIFLESARETGRVAQVVRSVIREPGEYVLCCPNPTDIRMPITIKINTPPTIPDDLTYFDPKLLSAPLTDEMFSDWRSTVFSFKDQVLSPYAFAQLRHLITHYRRADIGLMTASQQAALIKSISLERTVRMNTPDREHRSMAEFRLGGLEDWAVVHDKHASMRYLRHLSGVQRGAPVASPAAIQQPAGQRARRGFAEAMEEEPEIDARDSPRILSGNSQSKQARMSAHHEDDDMFANSPAHMHANTPSPL